MKLLVTGGAGYIGSHTTVFLAQAGHDVAILDNLSRSNRSVLAGISEILGRSVPFFDIDVRDATSLDSVFRGREFDAVVHFAALKSVQESVERPLAYYDNNVGGTVTLVDAMARNGCTAMVFSSSCTVYGEPDQLPVTETSPIRVATSPYGATKQMCERVLADAASAHGIRSTALRYFNPIGAHPSGKIGELLVDGPSNLVPYVARAAAGTSGPVPVFGTDYDTADGTAIRDYIDVMDLAAAHLAAIERLKRGDGPDFDAINIGTGRGRSVLQVITAFERATGVLVPKTLVERREGDVVAVWADASVAEMVLGWRAHRTLEESLSAVWRWEQRPGCPLTRSS